MENALKSGIGGSLSHPPVCGVLPLDGVSEGTLKDGSLNLREMLVVTPSTDLRNLHRDVWRMAHHKTDLDARTFLFAVAGDNRVIVRGPHLPPPLSRPVQPIAAGERWRFVIDVRAVNRERHKECLMSPSDMPGWMATKLSGLAIESLRTSLPRYRPFEHNRSLPYYAVAGTVRVTDVALAEQVLREGVGRSKGFGFGMLILTERLEGEAAADPRERVETTQTTAGG